MVVAGGGGGGRCSRGGGGGGGGFRRFQTLWDDTYTVSPNVTSGVTVSQQTSNYSRWRW